MTIDFGMGIDTIMSRKLVSVQMDDTLGEVKDIFEHTKFHHLLVVERGKLIGVLSDRDVFKAISPAIGTKSETTRDTATLNKKVHQVMSRRLITLVHTARIADAIQVFNKNTVSCLPVVDQAGVAVGVVSWRDIFKVLIEDKAGSAR